MWGEGEREGCGGRVRGRGVVEEGCGGRVRGRGVGGG